MICWLAWVVVAAFVCFCVLLLAGAFDKDWGRTGYDVGDGVWVALVVSTGRRGLWVAPVLKGWRRDD